MKFITCLVAFGIIFLAHLNISQAEDITDEKIVMQRLVREKWFEGVRTKDGIIISPQPGDVLYLGIQDILAGVLNNHNLKRTTFVGGDPDRQMVDIESIEGTDGIIFRFRKDLREYEEENSLIARVGGLVSACYFRGVKNDLDDIKKLRRSSVLTSEEALIMLLHYEYLSIRYTYDFYGKYAVPWSKSCNVDPIIWNANMSLPHFLKSKRCQMSKKQWSDWLEN